MDEKEEVVVSPEKLRKLRNLKYFREWTDEQIIDYIKNRKKNDVPPPNPVDIVKEIPAAEEDKKEITLNEKEYNEMFRKYFNKYKKELDVDMNKANDIESLRALVRFIIQAEQVDKAIFNEQRKDNPNTLVLKHLGDFQRTVQQNVNEIQDRLGISRKQRKEKQVDSLPVYIKGIQDKAKKFWERSTTPVRCEKCRIELGRYWLNFPDTIKNVHFELICENCKETIIYDR